MESVNRENVTRIINHRLRTPVNGYFGSSFGNDFKSVLFSAMNSSEADEIIQKLKSDEPLVKLLGDNVDIFIVDRGYDKKDFIININGMEFNLS